MTAAGLFTGAGALAPYYADESVALYLGDCRDVLPRISGGGPVADVCITDPPYGETSHGWDRWPAGWVEALAASVPLSTSLWCFGSARMFWDHRSDFAGWRLAQDIVWEKDDSAGFATDRFRRVHEIAYHFYRGAWGDVRHESPREKHYGEDKGVIRRAATTASTRGARGACEYVDDGYRMIRSVFRADRIRWQPGQHPTQKPVAVLEPLIRYSCPPGGIVLDPFNGSGSTAEAARAAGRKCIAIEAREEFCEATAERLAQGDLFGGAA